MNFNKVILGGKIAAVPELVLTDKGNARCDFAVVVVDRIVNKRGKEIDEAATIKVTAWGKSAEAIAKYMDKGSPILVEGRLREDGSVTLRRFQFVGCRKGA